MEGCRDGTCAGVDFCAAISFLKNQRSYGVSETVDPRQGTRPLTPSEWKHFLERVQRMYGQTCVDPSLKDELLIEPEKLG